jgi:hypothetical protein
MQKRQNLWWSLGLLAVAGLLFPLSFSALNHSLAIIILVLGVVGLLACLIVFWKNFRE